MKNFLYIFEIILGKKFENFEELPKLKDVFDSNKFVNYSNVNII